MPSNRNVPVEIREVEPFLQKCLDSPQLKLAKLEATTLVPLGENFCSVVAKVDAIVRKTEDADEEKLHFVAKTPINSQKALKEWELVIKPEIFAYTVLLPIYKEMEEKFGVEEVLDFYPKYIGHRLTLDDRQDEIDEHSMLLLENLTVSGYYVVDKASGLDIEHARKVLVCLARFHALGMALAKLRPEILKIMTTPPANPYDFTSFNQGLALVLERIRANQSLNKHIDTIESTFAEAKDGVSLWTKPKLGAWATIVHGDFWTNNIMFHKDASGRVDHVKFVDFQLIGYNNALTDLSRLMCVGLNETAKEHYDELLDLYYDTQMRWLDRFGCDSKAMTKELFHKELKNLAVVTFPLLALVMKLLTTKMNESGKNDRLLSEMMVEKFGDETIDALKRVIDEYEKRGWF